MTATAANTNGWAQLSSDTSPIIPSIRLPLQASAQVGRGQNATMDANGNVGLNDGTVPNLAAVGFAYPEVLSDTTSVTAGAAAVFWQGFGSGNPASTTANDGFLASDWGTPYFIANENTPGKLSNSGGNNRSLGGVVFGLDDKNNPRQLSGGIGWLLARATLVTQTKVRAWWNITDTVAGSTVAESPMYQEKLHGVVTNVEFVPQITTNADPSNYGTFTISKRNGAGGVATTIATLSTLSTSNGTATQFTTMQATLATAAGALNILETDIITIQETKNASGATTNGMFRVIQKVI